MSGIYYTIYLRLVFQLHQPNPLQDFSTAELSANLNQGVRGTEGYTQYLIELNRRLALFSDAQLDATLKSEIPGTKFHQLCFNEMSRRQDKRLAPSVTQTMPDKNAEPTEYMKTTYSNVMKRRISKAWFPPKGCEQLKVTVYFIIHNDGHVSDLRVTKSAGIEAADAAACAAVTNASPFNALPKESADDFCQVIYTFDNGPGMRRF